MKGHEGKRKKEVRKICEQRALKEKMKGSGTSLDEKWVRQGWGGSLDDKRGARENEKVSSEKNARITKAHVGRERTETPDRQKSRTFSTKTTRAIRQKKRARRGSLARSAGNDQLGAFRY